MKFCPKCHTLLRRNKGREGEYWECPRCGYTIGSAEAARRDEITESAGGLNRKKLTFGGRSNNGLFPFEKIREGQRQFLDDSREALQNGKIILAHAPTGIGKTAVALTAALERAKETGKKVFFLTSRQSQHRIAVETLKGIRRITPVRAVDIISKQQMCPLPEASMFYRAFNEFCAQMTKNRTCEYLTDRTEAVERINSEILHVQELTDIATALGTCPHKAALDAAASSDVIICDYNYIFSDEISSSILTRMEISLDDIIVIVDEAHNLPDRVRGILTDSITLNSLTRAEKDLRPVSAYLSSVLGGIAQEVQLMLADLKENSEAKISRQDFINAVERVLATGLGDKLNYDSFVEELTRAGDIVMKKSDTASVIDTAMFFLGWKSGGQETAYFASNRDGFRYLTYTLLDPSVLTEDVFAAVDSAIIMSGTLYPLEMYRDLLGIKERAVLREYASPFPPENRKIIVAGGVTTAYKQRSMRMYQAYANRIAEMARKIPGNVAVFFPSYYILEQVSERLSLFTLEKSFIVERQGMSKTERDRVLSELERSRKRNGSVLLGVMGGSLSEGVDYMNNLLSAVAIAGLPLSPPSVETEALKDYYSRKFGQDKGYKYAYLFPAINRVLQAAGRPIRSESDRGLIILMDDRYAEPRYSSLLPEEFRGERIISLGESMTAFFDESARRY